MNNRSFILFSAILFSAIFSARAQDLVTVRPVEISDVLNNPGIGFTTFQRFNGDTLNAGERWTEGYPIVYQDFDGDLTNTGYPQTTIAYFRVDWAFVEPEPGKYNWPMIDSALKTAAERGQRLMFRVAPYEQGDKDVPAWYRKMVGKEKKELARNWRIDPEDPRYLQYFGGLIKALGKRYDGNPALESVDVSIVGYWGEGEGSDLLKDRTRVALLRCYLDNFKRTTLTFQPLNGDAPDPGVLVKGTPIAAYWADGRNNGTGPQMRHLGYRCDCLGDVTTNIFPKKHWSHMRDVYPRDIVKSGMAEAWKKAPVTMEICYTFLHWLNVLQYDERTVEYIFNEALKWHISSFNAKSSPVPPVWGPLVNKWLNKMGYRYVLRKLEYTPVVYTSDRLTLNSLWENVGVAPIYEPYKYAVRLKGPQYTTVISTNANVLNWLPGDIVHEQKLALPADMPAGTYELEIAMVSPVSMEPKVKLAIAGVQPDGWYTMGKIEVKNRPPG